MAADSRTLVVLQGPTAIGKTALAIDWAQRLGTHILSADSRQFFREMAIGTAKPTPEELSQAPHHFVDCISVTEEYSAGQYERDVLAKLASLFQDHPAVILAGGSGLYVQAVTQGLDDMPADMDIRAELMHTLETKGLAVLQARLQELDPAHHDRMDLNNPQRLVRALEVCLATGKPYSSYRNEAAAPRPFRMIKIALDADRDWIYERINRRVDLMLETGLLEEVERLKPHWHLNALKTVGYREFFPYFNGTCSLEVAVEALKMNTRRFAKKQLTWLRRDPENQWFDMSTPEAIYPWLAEQLDL